MAANQNITTTRNYIPAQMYGIPEAPTIGNTEYFAGVPTAAPSEGETWMVLNTLTGDLYSWDGVSAWNIVGSGGGAVTSVFGRTGAVLAVASDYLDSQIDYTGVPANFTATNEFVDGALQGIDNAIGALSGTNLAYISAASGGVITSSTGTNATILNASALIAGLMQPGQFDKIEFISVTQAVDLDLLKSDTSTNASNISTNTTDISTNVGNISTNAANILTVTTEVTDLLSAIGIAANATDMGTYTGVTISDNVSQRTINQELETAIESVLGSSVTSIYGRTGVVVAQAGDYTALQVTNVPAGDIAAVTVQGAIDELDTEKEPTITAGLTTDYYRGDKTFQTLDTSAVIENTNLYFTDARAIGAPITGFTSGAGALLATDTLLEAIQKLDGNIGAIVTSPVASVFGRIGAVAAQAGDYTASLITNVPAGNIVATDIQDAINELDTEKEPAIPAGTTAQYLRGDKIFQTLTASVVANAPSGSIVAMDVQSAINELDTEKLGLVGGTMTGAIEMSNNSITNANAVTANTFNGVALTTAGSASLFLNQAGAYVSTAVATSTFDEILAAGGALTADRTIDQATFTITHDTGGAATENQAIGPKGTKLRQFTTTQRDALVMAAADAGYEIFNTTTGEWNYWDGTKWKNGQEVSLPGASITLNSQQDDYVLPDESGVLLINCTGNFNWTGIVPPSNPNGFKLTIVNIGTNDITFKRTDGNSLVANQFADSGVDVKVKKGSAGNFIYSTDLSKWLPIILQ